MVRYFHYHVPQQEHYFDAPIETCQCAQIKDDGLRCKRRVCIGMPYCYMHLKFKHFLCIKQSSIPNSGMGVFACNQKLPEGAIIFKKNERICYYDGEIISKEVLEDRYTKDYTAPYALEINKNRFEDGATHVGVGALINHKPMSKSNCRLSITGGKNRKGQIIATKNIKNNTELFLNYGKQYDLNQEGVICSRNNKKYNA